ncbi:MAG: hypothetical protein EOP21_07520 [Hyphomicrobiales bacterium]|nr:MAG: hypothetical protein EOP21_07520 [Hyphomicrobiales bacterium]
MWRMLEIILCTLAPLNRLEYVVAQLVTISPLAVWILALRGHAFVGLPLGVSWMLMALLFVYSFVFSIRRLLDAGIDTKAKAVLCILGCNGVSNILAMGVGRSILPVAYCVYYGGLLLIPSARSRPMWTQDLRA